MRPSTSGQFRHASNFSSECVEAMRELPGGAVTFLFTDIEGSTRLWEEHPEAMKRALAAHDRILREANKHNDGYAFATGGDSFAAAFARVYDGLLAAIEAQQALAGEDWGERAYSGPDGAASR